MARVVYCTVRGFLSQRRTFHAAALTYFSALSIVPFLAFSFSVLKGFGGYEALVNGMIHPWIQSTFPDNQPLQKALDQLLAFVQNTDVGTLGTIGLLTLTYTAISLLSTIEQAFNDIWGVNEARPLVRRVTDYVTLLVITPLLATAGASLTAAAQSSALMDRLATTLGPLVRAGFRLTSVVIVCVALGALYLIMPNTRVRLWAAATGGLVAGFLWQLALILQVNSQRAIASYSALYSGFSAVPIFFVWMYVSWTIVLAGAELASSYQHDTVMRQRRRARDADQGFRERLAIQVAAQVADAFLRGSTRWSSETLARQLRAPVQTTSEVIADLARANLLVRVGSNEPFEITPAADLDAVRVTAILNAIRHNTHTPNETSALERELEAPAAQVVDALEREAEHSDRNLTMRELALTLQRRGAVAEPAADLAH